MYEYSLGDILLEMCDRELDGYADAPEHKFSRRHDRAMKRIFRQYREARAQWRRPAAPLPKRRSGLRGKAILIFAVMIFLAVITGASVLKLFKSRSFTGEVLKDQTVLLPINYESAPDTIEVKYAPAAVPDGFELIKTESSPISVYYYYQNKETAQTIAFYQWTKSNNPFHYDTETVNLQEIRINDCNGLVLEYSDESNFSCAIIWDNGGYILEQVATLPVDEAIKVAESVIEVNDL